MTTFLDIFARSPITGLQRHIILVLEVLGLLRGAMSAYLSGDQQTVTGIRERISQLQQQADVAKHELISQLSPQLWSAVRRSELIALANSQDMVIHQAEDLTVFLAAARLDLDDSVVPVTLQRLLEYYDALVGSVSCCQQELAEIDELVETGFAAKPVARGQAILAKLENQELSALHALGGLYRHLLGQGLEPHQQQRLLLATEKLCQLNRDIRSFSTQFELILAK